MEVVGIVPVEHSMPPAVRATARPFPPPDAPAATMTTMGEIRANLNRHGDMTTTEKSINWKLRVREWRRQASRLADVCIELDAALTRLNKASDCAERANEDHDVSTAEINSATQGTKRSLEFFRKKKDEALQEMEAAQDMAEQAAIPLRRIRAIRELAGEYSVELDGKSLSYNELPGEWHEMRLFAYSKAGTKPRQMGVLYFAQTGISYAQEGNPKGSYSKIRRLLGNAYVAPTKGND
jgi:hypothetical protein